IAVDRGRYIRPGVPDVPLPGEERADLRGPEFLRRAFGFEIECEEELVCAAAAGHVEAVANDGWPGIANAGVREGPEQFRAAFRPFLEEAGFLRRTVAIGPAILRPIRGDGEKCRGKEKCEAIHDIPVGGSGVE